MGIYLNPKNSNFTELRNSQAFIDKSLLIEYTNSIMKTRDKYLCVSRPRRFGKSSDAYMLVAYYSKGCDSSDLFDDLKIANTDNYKKHLNKHNIIHFDSQRILGRVSTINEFIDKISKEIIKDLKKVYKEEYLYEDSDLVEVLENIYDKYDQSFIFIIDEWDCLFREYKNDIESQKKYLNFLRNLFKDQPYVELAYMTGILPIKKYGTHSTINMFDEISMIISSPLESFMGFTKNEVRKLCEQYKMSFNDMKEWYNGYQLENNFSVYCPNSIVKAIEKRKYGNYWIQTETYESLKVYIDMNFDGLKEDIISMLSGKKIKIDPNNFQNDMVTFHSKDDVYTLLVHLGYLGFNSSTNEVYIPNNEITEEFIRSIQNSKWQETAKSVQNSRNLLEATWSMNEKEVAKYIEQTHQEMSNLKYNSEECLSYTVMMAYFAAKDFYTIRKELETGKGYCDIAFIPKGDKPALLVELKWNKRAKSAIEQIKEKKYYEGLENYLDNLLLVGIAYNKDSNSQDYKQHTCIIEKYKNEALA